MFARPRRPLGALVVACALILSACGGGGGGGASAGGGGAAAGGGTPDGPVVVGLRPSVDGWSFPNFPSSSFPEVNFGAADVVSMFGSDETICVGGVAEPCELTAEAAAWARMVNQARASGHCEGLVVLASSRFNNKETPETVKLPTVDETLGAIMRAFATQFIPEVQENINKWMNVSLADKVAELKRSLATGKLEYTLGVYVAEGGHAVLPYAVEYPSPDVARIMIYDSNWPAKNRYVDVDLAAETWKFSFSGEDPENDPAVWTGGPFDMDLTPFDARTGTCPFCGKDVKVAKTTLLIRSANLEWSVESGDQVVTPETGVDPDGATAQPVKGISISSTSPQQGGGRSSYDYMVQIPNELLDEFLASQDSTTTSSTAAGQGGGVNLNFSGPSSVFALTPSGIAEVKTEGNSNQPINVTRNSIKTKDPSANVTLASENLVANASGSQVELQTSGGEMQVTVTAPNGQVISQNVTPDQPVVQMVADPASGGITVLAQTPTGEVQKTEVAPDGSQTTSVLESGSLDLNKTEVELPKGLESKPIESLPPLENRNLANPDYKPDAAYVAPTTVAPRTESGGQVAAGATTTVVGRNASSTTVAGRGVNTASNNSNTAASDDPVRPKIGEFRIPAKTFGDDPFNIDPPDSDSSGGFRFTSSKPEVATVALLTGRVTIVGAGATTITATQSAVKGFTTATATATLTVAKARPEITKPTGLLRVFGDEAFTLKEPTSSSSGAFSFDSSDEKVARVNRTSGRVTIVGAGRTTIKMDQAATDDYLAGSTDVVLTVRKAAPTPAFGAASSEITKTFGDADFDISAPTSESKGAFTFTSSNADVVAVTSAGKASVKGVGTATITASQAATDDHLAATTTMTVRVNRAGAGLSGFTDVSKVFGDAKFTLTAPKSAGSGAFTYSSDNTKVVTVNSTSGEVTIVGAGSATITATQAESATHSGGTITSKVTVDKAAPSITKFDPSNVKFGDEFTLAPESASSGAFTFSTDKTDVFEVDASTGKVKVLAMGTATLTVRQAATANYEAASRSVSVTVAKATPKIDDFAISAKTYNDTFTPAAPRSNSTGAFTFESKDTTKVTVLSNGSLRAVGVGTVTIVAKQASTASFVAGEKETTLTIDKLAPTLSAFTLATRIFGDAAFDLPLPTSTPAVRTPAEFTYQIIDPTTGQPTASSVASIATGTRRLTILAAGQVTIRATQAGDANHTASTIDATLTVSRATPTLSSFAIPRQQYSAGATFTLAPPVSTRNPASFTYAIVEPSSPSAPVAMTGVATIAGDVVTLLGAGEVVIRATQEGDANFSTATIDATLVVDPPPSAPVHFQAGEGNPISVEAPAGKVVTQILFASYGTPTGAPGSFTIGSCHASNSRQKVEQALLGRSSATISASNEVFGDPCGGVVKSLYVSVAYGDTVVLSGQQDGLSAASPGISAVQLKNDFGYTGNGNYWIKPTGYSGNAEYVWCDFDVAKDGGGWVLIGKGRQSNDNGGGWFGTDASLATAGLQKANAFDAGISKLSADFVNKLMNGTSSGWDATKSSNYLVANRINDALDGYGGVGDSWKIKVTSATAFSWIDQLGSTSLWYGQMGTTADIVRYPSTWMGGTATLTRTSARIQDTMDLDGQNNEQRLFTWKWDGLGGNHGWAAGSGVTAGFHTGNTHAIQFVQLWAR